VIQQQVPTDSKHQITSQSNSWKRKLCSDLKSRPRLTLNMQNWRPHKSWLSRRKVTRNKECHLMNLSNLEKLLVHSKQQMISVSMEKNKFTQIRGTRSWILRKKRYFSCHKISLKRVTISKGRDTKWYFLTLLSSFMQLERRKALRES
jgi:hypothetical protein